MAGQEVSLPEGAIATPDRIAVTRRVIASAQRVFALIADPRGHVRIDGSRMLVAAPDARPVTAVGDTFTMDMDREPLGDIPMGRYTVQNTITRFERGVDLAWAPGAPGRTPVGHVYGYRLRDLGDGTTEVTTYCDWSGLSQKWRERASWPVVPIEALAATLDALQRIVEEAADGASG